MTELPTAPDPRWTGLRRLLNDWDPIGVADLVDDEYDCLLAPLSTRLAQDATRASLAGFLRSALHDHFGLDPDRCGTDAFVARLLGWAATWPAGTSTRPPDGGGTPAY